MATTQFLLRPRRLRWGQLAGPRGVFIIPLIAESPASAVFYGWRRPHD